MSLKKNIADLVFVVADEQQPDPAQLLSRCFEFTPTGLNIISEPSRDEFDLLLMHLATQRDSLAFQTGDAAVEYQNRFGERAYEVIAARIGNTREAVTVESWASVCRRVPKAVRVEGLTFSHHKTVTPLCGQPEEQRRLLEHCKTIGFTVSRFEQYVYQWRRDHPDTKQPKPKPPSYHSDRLFGAERELYQAEVRLQETRQRARSADYELERVRATLREVLRLTTL